MSGLAVGFTSLHDRRDIITLHMSIKWFRIVLIIHVRGRMRRLVTKHKVVNPRTTAKNAIERFNLAAICNFLCEFVDAEMIREVSDR